MNIGRTALTFLVAAASLAPAAGSNDLAVIVNKQTSVEQATAAQLKHIFLGEKDKWGNGQKVTIVTLSLDHAETRTWLKELCGMTDQDYRKYFMLMSFQGKVVNLPHLLPSAVQVREAIAATPGAIGIVSMHDVDASVNVLNIDGAAPGTPAYKLNSQ